MLGNGVSDGTWLLVAQAVPEKGAPTAQDGLMSMLPAIALIMVLFYFIVLRPQKSKDQEFKSLLENLKETDRVITIGGIHGIVTNVQRDSQIATIRIDESTGTKIKVGLSAIARVVTGDEKSE